jgi:hypothetical protein
VAVTPRHFCFVSRKSGDSDPEVKCENEKRNTTGFNFIRNKFVYRKNGQVCLTGNTAGYMTHSYCMTHSVMRKIDVRTAKFASILMLINSYTIIN